jgi:hypothetical protein
MQKLIMIIMCILCFDVAYAQYYVRNTTVIDTPTAYTIARGTYQLSFLGYDNGGVELKAFLGFTIIFILVLHLIVKVQ